ncbi:alpha-L-fucosidase [Methylocystis iwaonis]|uniref:alpha-L-fucosidase n=1 Tax=Methylocystis iwaonis TaxID=2885079 RepID=UPI002E7B2428|nr:hypothetical protein [Methylocystis iwaonis]
MKINILIDNHLPSDIEKYDLQMLSLFEMEKFIDNMRPSRLTVFAIGHDGLAQYPSALAKIAPGLAYDLPAMWFNVARARNISCALYVSTLRNDVLLNEKPDWERPHPSGQLTKFIDHASPYFVSWLKPIIAELYERYKPDGFFFDGDYWAVGESHGPYRMALATEGNRPFSVAQNRQVTVNSYKEYLTGLGKVLSELDPDMKCSVNLAFTFRHPIRPPVGLKLITSDLPPFFGALDSWIETGVVLDAFQEREVVVPLFAEPEGGGRKFAKGKNQLVHEVAPLFAQDEAIHVYFPMSVDGQIDNTYVSELNAMRAEIDEVYQPDREWSIDPDVLCLAESDVLQATQNFAALRGSFLAASVAGLNVGIVSTDRCANRLSRARILILPDGATLSASGGEIVDRAVASGVEIVGPGIDGFKDLMVKANWEVDGSLVALLSARYQAGRQNTIWSALHVEGHWAVFRRGLVSPSGGWRLFLWNSIEKGEALGRHVLYDGAGTGGTVTVMLSPPHKIQRIQGYCRNVRIAEHEAELRIDGAFVVVEGL